MQSKMLDIITECEKGRIMLMDKIHKKIMKKEMKTTMM
jgi:hypothetical protein